MNAVPKEIKLLLKKAGFKKKDLKSKETALAIYEILLKEIDLDSGSKAQNPTVNRSGSIGSMYQFKNQIGERQSKRMVASSPEESRMLSTMQQHFVGSAQRKSTEGINKSP